jgi:hypothetical protein
MSGPVRGASVIQIRDLDWQRSSARRWPDASKPPARQLQEEGALLMSAPRTSLVGLILAGTIATAAVSRNGGAHADAADLADAPAADVPAADAPSPPPEAAAAVTAAVAAGRHWRLDTPRGPIHVWAPAGYHAATAATVVYVHGYYTDLDGAWENHQLPEQFALSGINALFIACEAPEGKSVPVVWSSLTALLRAVRTGIGEPLPRGRLVAIGHSGAYRTLVPWLWNPQLATVVLLDAAYDPQPFRWWIRSSRRHQLIDIGEETVHLADWLHRSLPGTVVVDALPPAEAGALPPQTIGARIVYIRSQVGHMPLVTAGVALPMVLRALSVGAVASAPWSEPLGVLPRPPPAPDGGPDAIAAVDEADQSPQAPPSPAQVNTPSAAVNVRP